MTSKDEVPFSPYSFSTLELFVHSSHISYIFMCCNKRFFIEASVEKLESEDDTNLANTLRRFCANMDDEDTMIEFEDWMYVALLEQLKELIPPDEVALKPANLLEYFTPISFYFELTNDNGTLQALQVAFNPTIHKDPSPRLVIVEAKIEPNFVDIWPKDVIPNCIVRSSLPNVPVFLASQLAPADKPGSVEDDMSLEPKLVRCINTNKIFALEADNVECFISTALDSLAKIESTCDDQLKSHTPNLVGLVKWDNEESLMGFLLDPIDGCTLYEAAYNASRIDKLKWITQVEDNVKRLHTNGIVWGDSPLISVIVNSAGDAILADFKGGFSPEYLDFSLLNTKEGDLLALREMRSKLLED